MNKDEIVNYATALLKSLEWPKPPSHNLSLKIGLPIILLQNLNLLTFCKIELGYLLKQLLKILLKQPY